MVSLDFRGRLLFAGLVDRDDADGLFGVEPVPLATRI